MKIEHDIENYLARKVKALGGKCIKLIALHEKGIPDRLVVLPKGRVGFVELKRPKGGRLSEMQKYQIEKLRGLGCKVYVAKNYDEVDTLLAEMQEGGAY